MAALAVVVVLLAAGRPSRCRAAGLLVVWLPAAALAAGAPAACLLPPAWPSLVTRLAGGVRRLTALGSGSGPIGDDPWPLAAWLLLAGAIWVAGAALASPTPSSARRRAIAFAVLAAPWIAAVAARHTDHGAWQGAAVLLAGLWRMRVLDVFVEDVWGVRSWVGVHDDLPQPVARVAEAKVVVRGLRNDLVVAPGRIDAVHAHGKVSRAPGEAWRLTPTPQQGDTYQVRASVVRATAAQLQAAPAPTDLRLPSYLDLYVRRDQGDAANHPPQPPADSWHQRPEPPVDSWHRVNVPLFGQPPDPRVTAVLERPPCAPVAALARQLATGATSQWDVVARVHRYLLDGDRYHYTTNPPQAGPYPLADFLLRDHAGYCQHFAGAAALLLRLAGVPARVVVGFASGMRQPDGPFDVRGTDAHAWIEGYFQGPGVCRPARPSPGLVRRRVQPARLADELGTTQRLGRRR
ncbi:MAG TPA: transglutaminase-like domain-containing protein [Actinomycetes bacterium]|jgi:hypothetical protein|nr:transglutaminase-like domain-containing protein [Actinomycetes bacterium]